MNKEDIAKLLESITEIKESNKPMLERLQREHRRVEKNVKSLLRTQFESLINDLDANNDRLKDACDKAAKILSSE